jgi:glucose/arabinose dehydrogenase
MSRIFSLAAIAFPLFLVAQENPTRIALQTWASGFDRPVYATHAGDNRLFVVEQLGMVKIVTDSNTVLATPFLDITDQVHSGGNEQGLLGLAFDPDYATNGYFYVYFIRGFSVGASRIARFQVSANPDVADPASQVNLYDLPQLNSNHNGGSLLFGPDGYLYFGWGDGGGANDPPNSGQDLSTVFGSMMRIDVSQHNDTFLIPPTNPFVDATDTLPQIWASGLRNPWRFSFDRQTGDLWIADVGQNLWEELDFWPAGDNSGPNFGWRCREGLSTNEDVDQTVCGAAEDYVSPIAVFNHADQGWCSIIGGNVYRGETYPHLFGKYIFTDYCNGDFLTSTPTGQLDTLLQSPLPGNSAFAEDATGELYVVNVEFGTIKKIVDACPMNAPEITFDGQQLSSNDAETWQWYLDGEAISEANGQTLEPLVNGVYTVLAGYGVPCELFSTPLAVIVTGLHSTGADVPVIYPQPASDRLHMRVAVAQANASRIDLVDVMGRIVHTSQWPAGVSEYSINVADLSPGSYIVRGTGNGGNWRQVVDVAR